jgi:hypothetical protein
MQILTRSYKPRQCNVYLSGAPVRGTVGAGDERDDREPGTRGWPKPEPGTRGWPEPAVGRPGGGAPSAEHRRWSSGVGRAGPGGRVGREGGWRCSGDRGVGRLRYDDSGDGAGGGGVEKRSKNEVKKKLVSAYVRRFCRVLAIWHSTKIFF